MRFTKVPTDAFEKMQLNAGVFLSEFDPATAQEVDDSKILGATKDGCEFTAEPSFTDFGEDIDNMPANTMELKRYESIECKMAGTFISADTRVAKMLINATAETEGALSTITPLKDLTTSSFNTIWWVGDYSNKNGEKKGGYIAIELKNALNTGGFKLTSANNGKGEFGFEFTGHYSMAKIDEVPYTVYIKAGEDEPTTAE